MSKAPACDIFFQRREVKPEFLLDLSIEVSGGKETKKYSHTNGELMERLSMGIQVPGLDV